MKIQKRKLALVSLSNSSECPADVFAKCIVLKCRTDWDATGTHRPVTHLSHGAGGNGTAKSPGAH